MQLITFWLPASLPFSACFSSFFHLAPFDLSKVALTWVSNYKKKFEPSQSYLTGRPSVRWSHFFYNTLPVHNGSLPTQFPHSLQPEYDLNIVWRFFLTGGEHTVFVSLETFVWLKHTIWFNLINILNLKNIFKNRIWYASYSASTAIALWTSHSVLVNFLFWINISRNYKNIETLICRVRKKPCFQVVWLSVIFL